MFAIGSPQDPQGQLGVSSQLLDCTRGKIPPFGFLPRLLEGSARCPVEHWRVRAIFRQERPRLRNSAIRATSRIFLGLPSRLPFAFALRSPARTRSQMRDLSSSATAPRTVNTILPVGVDVSTPSVRLTNSMPSA